METFAFDQNLYDEDDDDDGDDDDDDDGDDGDDFTATRVRWVFVDNQDSDANAV